MYSPYFIYPPSVHEHLGCYRLLALWTVLLWTLVYKYLMRSLLSVLSFGSPAVESLDHTVVLCLAVEETTVLFSTGAASCYVSTSKAQGFQSLQGLASTCCFLFFVFIVKGVKWYLVVVLICVWLMSNAVERICLCTSSVAKCLFKPFSHFLNCIVCFFWCWVIGCVYIFYISGEKLNLHFAFFTYHNFVIIT